MSSTQFLTQENARLRQENDDLNAQVRNYREFVRTLQALADAGHHFKDDSELMPFLRKTLSHALNLLDTSNGSLALLDFETKELVFMIVEGQLSEDLEGYRLPVSEGIMGWVVRNGKPVLVPDCRRDLRFSSTIDQAFSFTTQSLAAAPLIGDRRVYGVVELVNQPGDTPFNEDDIALLRLMCNTAGEALADMDRLRPRKQQS